LIARPPERRDEIGPATGDQLVRQTALQPDHHLPGSCPAATLRHLTITDAVASRLTVAATMGIPKEKGDRHSLPSVT
jgi:hypothetical protein